jgi:hypothetical protein
MICIFFIGRLFLLLGQFAIRFLLGQFLFKGTIARQELRVALTELVYLRMMQLIPQLLLLSGSVSDTQ